ncbi:MAG TPA: glycosyltransferase family 4 protein [Ohtaekwangia sp.]|nr:glycosyltransferase family 4 protein [Ohtaekwangia sp.]
MDNAKLAVKILFVVTGFPDNKNLARSVFNYRAAQYLGTHHQLDVIRLKLWRPFQPLCKKVKVNDVEVNEVATFAYSFFSFSPWIINFLLKLSLLGSAKRLQGDIVHAVGGGLAAQFSALLSKRSRIPYIIQYIGSDLNFYLKSYASNKTIRKIIRGAGFHCFNSKALQKLFEELFPNYTNFKQVIYRGVDTREFNGRHRDMSEIKFLFLGGFVTDDNGNFPNNLKGGITLLKAWRELMNKNEYSCSLTIAGPGTMSFRYDEFLGNKEKINLRILGTLNRKEVAEEMSRSHCVVIPSISEGLPNVAFEAMASGNVIIGSDVGGIPEVIEHKINGILIVPNDTRSLVEALSFVCTNHSFIRDAGLRNTKKAQVLSIDSFVSSYTSVYNTVITTYTR